jgi:DNA-3-methyladenine glycosylase II
LLSGLGKMTLSRLDQTTFAHALTTLAAVDADLAAALDRWGMPPLWQRPPTFPTLLRTILEQQVSLASARATYQRLTVLAAPLTPESFLAQDDDTLRAIGFSRQKTRYVRELALAIAEERLDLTKLEALPDEDVRTTLIALPGIGAWTAEIFLLTALRRADAWPTSDLGVIVGVQRIKQLPYRPSRDEIDAIAAAWRPWRGAVTYLLWYDYLKGKLPEGMTDE